MGDYNLNLRDSNAKDAFIDEPLIIIRDANSEKRIITIQNELTTLKAKPADGGCIDGYRNNFDHFTYDSLRPIDVRCWAVDVPNNSFYAGDYERYLTFAKDDQKKIVVEMTKQIDLKRLSKLNSHLFAIAGGTLLIINGVNNGVNALDNKAVEHVIDRVRPMIDEICSVLIEDLGNDGQPTLSH